MSSSADPKALEKHEGADGLPVIPLPTEYPTIVKDYRNRDFFMICFFIRLVNAMSVVTFFQPDEYYQTLEPAWKLAYGPESGAWITWVCIYSDHTILQRPLLTWENRNGNIN